MSLYTDVVSDQLPAAIRVVRSQCASLKPTRIVRTIFPVLITFLRKYWVWAFYFIIIRKLYRILSRTNRRNSRPKKIKRSSASIPDSSESALDSEVTIRSADVAFVDDHTNSIQSNKQVLVGDGVIVVNRGDRFVEVYERKNISKIENADAEVENLLREFTARSLKMRSSKTDAFD